MVEHRRTPSRKAFVPPSWFIIVTVVAILGSAGWLGWSVADGNDTAETSEASSVVTATPAPVTSAPASTPAPEKTPASEKTSSSEKTGTPETPSPAKPKAPVVRRDFPVSVLNNTRSPGLAASFAARVRQAGWNVLAVGNWRGSIVGNTVYYPRGLQDRAALLGRDLGISRVLPGIAPMRMDRLTIILSGPQ